MQYHCPECRKAVIRERIWMLPWILLLIYMAVANEHVPPGTVYGLAAVCISLLGLHWYFKQHP